MAEICRIVTVEAGNRVEVRWEFGPRAHDVGIARTRGRFSARMDGDLGQPEGADKIEDMLINAAREVSREIQGAWGSIPLF